MSSPDDKRYYVQIECSVDAASFDEAETKIRERLSGHVNDLNVEVLDEPEEIETYADEPVYREV